MNGVGRDLFRRGIRRDEHIAAEQKLASSCSDVQGRAVRARVRVLQKKGPVDRESIAGGFFGQGVEIRHEPITLLDIAAAYRFLLGAVYPDLMHARSLRRVVAIDGLKRGKLEPLGKQRWRR